MTDCVLEQFLLEGPGPSSGSRDFSSVFFIQSLSPEWEHRVCIEESSLVCTTMLVYVGVLCHCGFVCVSDYFGPRVTLKKK